MKYIIFEDNKTGLLQPVILGEHTTHSNVEIEGATAISAGSFAITKEGIQAFGNSESLGLSSKAGDSNLLQFLLLDMGTMFFMQMDFKKETSK